jgi:8-oxo-dGTP pyrophosphatase MutT (NUDIX family)
MELSWRSRSPKIDMMRTYTSYGVILVRNTTEYDNECKYSEYNKHNHNVRLEALLVKGRCSYEFLEFVSANKTKKPLHIYKTLFSQMYIHELTCILSLHFDFMWHHAWLGTNKNKDMYLQQKQRFEEFWLAEDGGKELVKLVKTITPLTKNMRIEFPKGRMKNRDETELECACREVKEETGIDSTKYTIIPGLIKIVTFIQLNIRYVYKYFVGVMNEIEPIKLNLHNLAQVSEIMDIQWMTFDQICRIDKRHRLERIIAPIFEYLSNSRIATIRDIYNSNYDEKN